MTFKFNSFEKTIFLLLILFTTLVHAQIKLRPSEWAVPVIGSSLENFYALDSNVYRSEQPDGKAFAELEKFGIKEVLNLRQFHTDDDEAEETQIKLHHVKMNAGNVKTEEIIQALKIIQNAKGPVLIHCMHGSDRTGIVCAAYRMVFQDWSKEKAIEEHQYGGYGYHDKIYPNIIETINSLDVEAIKRDLGLVSK